MTHLPWYVRFSEFVMKLYSNELGAIQLHYFKKEIYCQNFQVRTRLWPILRNEINKREPPVKRKEEEPALIINEGH